MSTAGGDLHSYSLVANEDNTELVLSLAASAAKDEAVVARIHDDIKSLGLTASLDEGAFERICGESRGGSDARAVIAAGVLCQHGTDGKLLWAKKLVAPKKDEKRSSHYLGMLEKRMVRKGDPVARIVPETEGTNGEDIYGKTVKARKGKPAKVRVGPGLREAEGIVYAEKKGMIRMENGQMKLDETFVVDGDLGFETGNIDFPGSVIIGGGVLDLFEIKAGGSIQIKGVVEAATISAKGDIEIAGGLASKNKGSVVTEGSLAAQFLVNAHVFAEGDVCIEGEVLSSKVTALGAIRAAECSIAGGHIEALGGIYAEALGSDIGIATHVAAGVCETLPDLCEANAARIDDARTRLLDLKRLLISASASRAGSRLATAKKEIREIQSRLCSCLMQRKRLALAWQSAKPLIVVSRMIYPGVTVTVGPYSLEINQEIKGPVKLQPDRRNKRVRILANT